MSCPEITLADLKRGLLQMIKHSNPVLCVYRSLMDICRQELQLQSSFLSMP